MAREHVLMGGSSGARGRPDKQTPLANGVGIPSGNRNQQSETIVDNVRDRK